MDFPEYRQAVIHLSWFRDGQVRHLLFGMIELRPNELSETESCVFPKAFRVENKGSKYLYYRRFALPVADAIEWYKNAADSNLILPHDPKCRTKGDGAKLEGSKFVQEPSWTHFVSSNELVFAPEWMHGSRTHFLFPENVLSPEVSEIIQSEKYRAKLEEWLNFDIVEAYPEYLGAICLVAPNPLFRSIEKSHFEQAGEDAAETVAYKLVARQGQRLNGLRLEIVNERLRGRMTPLVHEFDNDAIVVLDFPAEIYKEGRSITHPKYGLMEWSDPLSIARTISTTIELHRRRKRVQVPADGDKRPGYEYEVNEVEDAGDIIIGDTLEDAIGSRLIEAKNRRSRRQAAEDYDQKWFHREPSEAAQYIRRKIGKAHNTVLIVDPYFAGRELLGFGHAIRRSEVQVRILTSARVLKKKAGPQLLTFLNDTFKDDSTKPKIRVMGQNSSVHDRFLIVDDIVWLSGNSLHTIGERAGMIIKLPDPEPVIELLHGFWCQAPTLPDWLTNRPASGISAWVNRLKACILRR